MTEQRYKAVLAVISDGGTGTAVARDWDVSRQTLHEWLSRYEDEGLEGLANRSHRPTSCPHQMPAEVEVQLLELRRARPYLGARRLALELARKGVQPAPSKSAVQRSLARAGVTDPERKLRRLKYQMVFAYTENGVIGTAHVPAGGAFTAPISLTDSGITIASIAKASTGAGIGRPSGATDQDAIALVGKAMAACAGVSAESVADCPQAEPDVIIQNVHWKLNGDPTSGATVQFDAITGTFVVHGNSSMSVAYTWFGNARNRTSSMSAYDAYLLWNGQPFQLVTIRGASS